MFCAGGLIAREDVDANVDEPRDGGGIVAGTRIPLFPVFVRGVSVGATSDVPMRGDDGRLCVAGDGAETGLTKAV